LAAPLTLYSFLDYISIQGFKGSADRARTSTRYRAWSFKLCLPVFGGTFCFPAVFSRSQPLKGGAAAVHRVLPSGSSCKERVAARVRVACGSILAGRGQNQSGATKARGPELKRSRLAQRLAALPPEYWAVARSPFRAQTEATLPAAWDSPGGWPQRDSRGRAGAVAPLRRTPPHFNWPASVTAPRAEHGAGTQRAAHAWVRIRASRRSDRLYSPMLPSWEATQSCEQRDLDGGGRGSVYGSRAFRECRQVREIEFRLSARFYQFSRLSV